MKKTLISTAVALLATSSIGLSNISYINAQESVDTMGENVTYDLSQTVNNGEDITIQYWTWNTGDPVINLAEAYQELHPNVTLEIVNHPWDDFWTKLPLSLQGSDGPALFNIHNSQHDLLINYLAPYAIDTEALKADFNGVEPHIIDGEIHYIDNVMNTGNMYYNVKLWEEAGLTEEDIPVTWDEFREVAKKLTKHDGDNLIQAGFNWNGETYSGIYQGLNYQKGELLFQEDGKTVNFDNESTKENLQFLVDLYDVDKVGHKDFGVESAASFGNGQSAMVYKWGWFISELDNNYPDIEYGVFATPTATEEVPMAYDRYNGESTPGINSNQSEEQQAVAQDFIRYILANDDYSVQAALSYASYPTKVTVADHEEILNHPILQVMAPRVDRLIWPGPFPSTVESTATQAMEEVLYNGVDIATAVQNAQRQMERDMRNAEFNSLESSYQFIN